MTITLRHPSHLPRASILVAALLAVTALCFGVVRAAAQDSASSAIPSQDGWWNRAQGPVEGEPPTPLRPILAPVPPPPNTVPAHGLAVGASGGEADKVAAVGLVLDAPPGALADRLVLALEETDENGSNLNAAQAVVAACPITTYWAGAANGDWQNRPTCDDSRLVAGTRADDGTWTFDLTAFASAWLDFTTPQNGVLLVEGVDAPQTFQVTYKNIESGGVKTQFATTGGGFSGSGVYEAPEPTPAPAPQPAAPISRPRSVAGPAATTPAPQAPVPAVTAAPAPLPPVASGPTTLDATIWGNLPVAMLIGVPLLLGGAGALAYALGPAGRPRHARRRSGSVTRVLDAQSPSAATS